MQETRAFIVSVSKDAVEKQIAANKEFIVANKDFIVDEQILSINDLIVANKELNFEIIKANEAKT